MGKGNEKKLVGQPIFNQILQILPIEVINRIVLESKSDRYYKSFSTRDELTSLLFGVFTRCDSSREICDGMAALGGKLNYLGMDSSPAKSTFNDGLNNRSESVFEKIYFSLIDYFLPLLSASRKEDVCFDKFYAFDSTTISLFSQVMKGVGRKRKDDGRKKGGLKVHMLTDIHADAARFVKISEAKSHDKNFLKHLVLPKGSMLVFDKAYNHYLQFAEWTAEGINFVCRLKDNAIPELQEVRFEKTLSEKEPGVMKEEHIHLQYALKQGGKKDQTLSLRKVSYRDEKGRIYRFITNNWEISNEEVALMYRYRWTIELVFKKMKQNFQLHFFYSESENGIKTQIWATLIAHLLLTVIKRKSNSKKAFSTMAALVRIHLISYLGLYWVIENGRRSYNKRIKSRNKVPDGVQLLLFN
ncbi:MAG: IS4 family transposase [Tannerella sp.]|jgi:hypothetical protein|nr:IS4 family transposase [Tannerella sp.]